MLSVYLYHLVLQISIMDSPLSPDMDREKEMMMELQVGNIQKKNKKRKNKKFRRRP